MAQLYFSYAAMNSGKTASLLTAAHNYKERGMGVLLLKPAIDNRESSHSISSRIGISQEANAVTPDMDLYEFYRWAESQKDIHCVFVDEAQFLEPTQIKQLARIVDNYNVPVMCYGLRTDFQGKLFPGAAELLATADKLVELKGVCHCGRKATMTARVHNGIAIKDGVQVSIGGNDSYVSLCRKHWVELIEAI